MVKQRTVFCCSECGGESVKWYGRCPHCGAWNTLTEEKVIDSKAVNPGQMRMAESKPLPLPQIRVDAVARWVLGMGELDEVLGGGLTPGSSILLGGEPGIGKSTLLLQAAAAMSAHGRTLYISGEESAEQIRLRAERLSALSPQVYLLAQTDINAALAQARALDISLLIVDSVQAVYSPDLVSAPGSVSQVRAVAAACLALAREKGCAVMLIGHVTKEGMLAGPRVLEHMVDTVLYFEGERHTSLRLLRAVKNRFGSTNELGVFEMGAQGLASLAAPSAYFIGER
ncbi:MAG: DNA repair protein RadA, partial [Clostridiales bacterium]